MKLTYLLTAMSLLFGSTLAPAVADVLEDVKQAGELRVGTETAFPPFDYIEEGRHVGLNVDLFDEIGKELGVSVRWVNLPWMGVLPALASRRFDIVAGPATITKARLERYRFSSPVGDAQVNLIKRRGDASIAKPEDIAGRTVGGGQGSSQLDQLKAFAADLPTPPKLREYVGANEGLADLTVGRIDAWASSLPNNAAAVSARPDAFEMVMPPFGPKLYLAYVGRKDPDSASLMRAVDGALAKMRTDGRMDAIQQRWLGVTPLLPSSVDAPEL